MSAQRPAPQEDGFDFTESSPQESLGGKILQALVGAALFLLIYYLAFF